MLRLAIKLTNTSTIEPDSLNRLFTHIKVYFTKFNVIQVTGRLKPCYEFLGPLVKPMALTFSCFFLSAHSIPLHKYSFVPIFMDLGKPQRHTNPETGVLT